MSTLLSLGVSPERLARPLTEGVHQRSDVWYPWPPTATEIELVRLRLGRTHPPR